MSTTSNTGTGDRAAVQRNRARAKLYQQTVGRLRKALLTARELTRSEMHVGLLMLEYTNRSIFDRQQLACSWLSEDHLANMAGLSGSGIRKARSGLRRKDVVRVVRRGGRGPRSTSVYAFNTAWADNAQREFFEREEKFSLHRSEAAGSSLASDDNVSDSPLGSDKGLPLAHEWGAARGPESLDKSFEEIGSRSVRLSHAERVGERNMHSRKERRQWCDLISEAMQLLRLSQVEANALMNLLTSDEIEEVSSSLAGSDQFENVLQKAIERQKAANSV